MKKLNNQRELIASLREICARRGIEIAAFSGDWVLCLKKGERRAYVFGYDFGINSAVAKMICKDKTATSDLLRFHDIAHIEHRIFHGPQLAGYVPMEGNWGAMLAFLAANPAGVVCKPNEGTGGNAVYRARTAGQLEAAVYQVFAKSRSLCLSPFEDFEHEYRVALLKGEVQFVYRKVRPGLTGDGIRTIRTLFLDQFRNIADFTRLMASMKELAEADIELERVPALNELVLLNWRHNLGQGAAPELLTREHDAWQSVTTLARRAAEALSVDLASLDIAATAGGLKILEINSGIMMESLVETHPDGPDLARQFYDRIVCTALGLT